jgi:hypothetical protein
LSLFFFLERAIFIDPSAIVFLTLNTPLKWKHLFAPPSCKIEINVFPNSLPFQFLGIHYMRVELWTNHNGIKLRCYWERLREQLGNTLGGASREHDENILGTHWEQGRKTKKKLPHPQKEKKTGPMMMSA